jgi:hypothetical protein
MPANSIEEQIDMIRRFVGNDTAGNVQRMAKELEIAITTLATIAELSAYARTGSYEVYDDAEAFRQVREEAKVALEQIEALKEAVANGKD